MCVSPTPGYLIKINLQFSSELDQMLNSVDARPCQPFCNSEENFDHMPHYDICVYNNFSRFQKNCKTNEIFYIRNHEQFFCNYALNRTLPILQKSPDRMISLHISIRVSDVRALLILCTFNNLSDFYQMHEDFAWSRFIYKKQKGIFFNPEASFP